MMVINTSYPSWTPARMFRGKTNLNLNYLIKAPRQSTLLIKHGIGEVEVTNVYGDIEATASIGQISLILPEGQSYAVDARVRIGDVSSEFGQTTKRQGLFAVGAKLAGEPSAPTRRIFLRVGIGDIQVAKLQAEKSVEQGEKKDEGQRRPEAEGSAAVGEPPRKRCSPTWAHLIAKVYPAPPLPRPHDVVGSNRLSFNSEDPLTTPLRYCDRTVRLDLPLL